MSTLHCQNINKYLQVLVHPLPHLMVGITCEFWKRFSWRPSLIENTSFYYKIPDEGMLV